MLSNFVFLMVPGKDPTEFHLCSGTNPKLNTNLTKHHIHLYSVYTISILVNTILPIAIATYRCKNLKEAHLMPSKWHFKPEFITDLTTSFSIVALMGANLRTFVASHFTDPDLMNAQPVRVHLAQLFVPNFVGLIIFIVFYIRNKSLRLGVLRAIKEALI